MKQPLCEPEEFDWAYDDQCGMCLVTWPCPEWMKWTGSKDYRIQELERERQAHAKQIADLRKCASSAEDRLHKLETTVKGIWPALTDLLAGHPGGTLSVRHETQYHDTTTFEDNPARARVAALVEYEVNYESPAGVIYRDGRAVEWRTDR